MTPVSVVIPTYKRPYLVQRAVCSVLAQTYRCLEVVVVIDGVDDGTRSAIDTLHDPRTRVVETGINRGPAEARNFGVRQAKGHYVAILDDDDEWTEQKLERQMSFIQEHSLQGDFLLSCRTIQRNALNGETLICPSRPYSADKHLSEYILDRRLPFRRPGLVASGTLLFPRSLALRVPFPNDRVHEDWSWLLVCVIRDRVPLMMCEEPMFIYNINPAPSRNTISRWNESLEWGRCYRKLMTGRAFAGLVSSTTAWRAKRQDGMRAFPEIARAMREEGHASIMHWLTLLGVMVFPSSIAERLRRHSYRHPPRVCSKSDMAASVDLAEYVRSNHGPK